MRVRAAAGAVLCSETVLPNLACVRTGHLQRDLRAEAGPRRDGGGLRQRGRQGLLDREELVGTRVGGGRLHPHGAQRASAHGQVWHRHGRVVPGEEWPQPDG